MEPKSLVIDANSSKSAVFQKVKDSLTQQGFTIAEEDQKRPWGGFFRIADEQAPKFIETYFAGIEMPPTVPNAPLSPKILILEPGKQFSWQVHERRAEFWRVLTGPVGTYLSETDEQPQQLTKYYPGNTINVPHGMRHRLLGLDNWALVPEIWIHTDPNNPSDEADVKRLADDFGRQN